MMRGRCRSTIKPRPLTDKQLQCLASLGSPSLVLMSAPYDDMQRYRALENRGLVEPAPDPDGQPVEGTYRITADGLRALADNLDRVDRSFLRQRQGETTE